MLLKYIPGMMFSQKETWVSLREEAPQTSALVTQALIPLALIAPVSAFFGTTLVGWRVGGGEAVKLTSTSAFQISIAYFLGIIIATLTVAKFIQWMSETYGAEQPYERCLTLAVFAGTPLYLCGILQLYPVIWLNYILGLPLFAYSLYLLFSGITRLMEVPQERAFLFGSAVLVVGLVALVGLMAATVVLWGVGIEPEFTASHWPMVSPLLLI